MEELLKYLNDKRLRKLLSKNNSLKEIREGLSAKIEQQKRYARTILEHLSKLVINRLTRYNLTHYDVPYLIAEFEKKMIIQRVEEDL